MTDRSTSAAQSLKRVIPTRNQAMNVGAPVHPNHQRYRVGDLRTRDGIRIPGIRRLSAHELEYSGDELAHFSDFPDTPPQSYTQSSPFGSFVKRNDRTIPRSTNAPYTTPMQPAQTARNVSESSGFHIDQQDDEKVIWHGYLLCLKTKRGVRQWEKALGCAPAEELGLLQKRRGMKRSFSFHSTRILSVIPGIWPPTLSSLSLISSTSDEIDPISRSKAHCMQIIAEEKSYRFCASSEDALAEWLGALKSQLARRKDKKFGNSWSKCLGIIYIFGDCTFMIYEGIPKSLAWKYL